MRIIGWVGVAVAVVAFAAGRVSAGEGDRPAAPATVKAKVFREAAPAAAGK